MKEPSDLRQNRRSLTYMLAVSFLAISVLVLLVSSGIELYTNYRTQKETIFSRQQLVAQHAAQSVAGFVQERFEVLETAARLQDIYLMPVERQRQMLQSLLGVKRSFRQLLLLDDEGRIVVRASRISLQSSPLSEPFCVDSFVSARDGKRYISPVYIDHTTSEPMMVIALPLFNILGDFKGSLVVEVNLKFMWDLIETLKVGETGKAYVVDRQGGVIAFGDTARVLMGENVGQLRAVEEFVNDTQFLGPSMSIYAGITGELVLGTYVPLKVPDWAVVTELPLREAYSGIGRNLLWTLLIIVTVLVSAGVFGIYAARRLTVPLVHLTETADRIASGERELMAVVGGPLETSRLAKAFNSMTLELRRSFGELEEQMAEVKRAEERVKASEAMLRSVFRAAPIGIAFISGRIIMSANQSLCELTGYSEEELVGKSARQLYETEQEFEQAGRDLYSNLSLSGKNSLETRMRRKDGRIITVKLSMAVLHAEDPAGGYAGTIEDITERRKAESALRESEERLRLALMAANQGLWDLNLLTGQAQVSPEYEMMLGFDPGELEVTLSSWSEALHPEDRQRTGKVFDDYLSGNSGEYRVEFRQRTKSGEYKWLLSMGKVVAFDKDGSPVRMVGLHTDLDHRKRMEEALQRTQFCVDHSREAVSWIASDGRLVYVNEAACEMLEYSRKELLEMSIFDVVPQFSRESWDEHWGMRLRTGSALVEILHETKTGRIFPAEVSVNVVHFAGQAFLSAFTRDISERKEAERSLRESEYLLSKSQQVARLGSYYFDALSGKWIGSPMLDELLGIDGSYPHDTNGWIELVHPEQKEEMRRYLEDHVISKHNTFNKEYRIVRDRDGGEVWVHGLGELEFDESGNILRMIGTLQDITERRLAEEEIRSLNEELENRVLQRTAQFEAANRELEAFAYSVSHDLRAPLRAVDGFTRILLEDHSSSLNDEGRRVCGIICEEAQRMGGLIDDLLTYSRMGRIELIQGVIEMESLAISVFHELTTDEDRKRIEFRVGPLPSAVSDGTMLHHVWSNLIGNAVKFTSKRERAIIEVGADQNENETIYYVRDNGAGFDMRYSQKLFGMFQRLHNVREFEGTGVGLAIVQRLVQRHGGRIWAWGEPDKGAAFYFTIPRPAAQC